MGNQGTGSGGGSGQGSGENQAQPQVKLRYASSGSSASNNDNKAAVAAARRSMAGPMGVPAAPAEAANMGLPLSLAAVSPFLALLGKAVKKKGDD